MLSSLKSSRPKRQVVPGGGRPPFLGVGKFQVWRNLFKNIQKDANWIFFLEQITERARILPIFRRVSRTFSPFLEELASYLVPYVF